MQKLYAGGAGGGAGGMPGGMPGGAGGAAAPVEPEEGPSIEEVD